MARNRSILEIGIPKLIEFYEKVTGKPQVFVFICTDANEGNPQSVLLSNLDPPEQAVSMMRGAIKALDETNISPLPSEKVN